MVDVPKMLTNPWVLGGGALIGLLLLLGRANNANAAQPTAYVSGGNAAGYDYSAHLADVAAATSQASIAGITQEHLGILSYLTSMAQTKATVQQNADTVNAGVAQSKLAASAAVTLDASQQAERYKEAYLGASVSKQANQLAFTQHVDDTKAASDLSKFSLVNNGKIAVQLANIDKSKATTLGQQTVNLTKYTTDAAVSQAAKQTDSNFWAGIWQNIFNIVPSILKL